jgi:hypothetical protein
MASRDLVSELEKKVGSGLPGSQPWYAESKLTKSQQAVVKRVAESWLAGRLGTRAVTAAIAISESEAFAQAGIKIGHQGVCAWLKKLRAK